MHFKQLALWEEIKEYIRVMSYKVNTPYVDVLVGREMKEDELLFLKGEFVVKCLSETTWTYRFERRQKLVHKEGN